MGFGHVNIEQLGRKIVIADYNVLSFEQVRLSEVKRTELLIELEETPSYCHSSFSSPVTEEESPVSITITRGSD